VAVSRIAPARPSPGEEAFLERAQVRDVLAWLRLLADPTDAAAVVRALARPPIELRQVELARVIQVARRRKLDLVRGLAAATESPAVPPEARERVQRFVALHARATAMLEDLPPDALLARLIELLHAGRPPLATRERAGEHDELAQLLALAADYVRATPRAGVRELARHLATVAAGSRREGDRGDASAAPAERSPSGSQPGEGDHPSSHQQEPDSQDPDGQLRAMFELLREEVLDGVGRIGGRLGELRLDTELDVSHGVVRYLELLKLSALLQRPPQQGLADALADVNARLLAAATTLQREILLTSPLDAALEAGGAVAAGSGHTRASAIAPREQHSLVPFLPRKGAGLALSASDVYTYRSCPLRYKYARVLRIPVEQTVNQRFGIVVHQVLERYHREGGQTLAQMLALLDGCWRRAGFGGDGLDGELLEKAHDALTRYHARLRLRLSTPLWFERQFCFQLGAHQVRGRIDRVDRLDGDAECEDAEYELIDYKTSRPKSVEQLGEDIQLSLYALAAREDWKLASSRQAYYYVLDDLVVPVPCETSGTQSVEDVVLEVGDGILAQEFEPAPSPGVCGMCDYRILCPVAEA
jgi:DNA helicase-2/ATP-dependent DNA helicase PcrA